MIIDSTILISFLLVFLCILAGLDLWRQYALNSEDTNFVLYEKAIKGSYTNDPNKIWKLGYRTEDLQDILLTEYTRMQKIRSILETTLKPSKLNKLGSTNTLRSSGDNILLEKAIQIENTRQARPLLHEILTNDSSVFHIHCETHDGPLLRVGENDFRTDIRDQCQLFGSNSQSSLVPGPHNMFEQIPLEEGEFALRSIGSNYYIRVVPPPSDHTELPWKLVIGGPVIGAAERFRMTSEGYLYSSLLGGFFQCRSGQMVQGYNSLYSKYNKFIFQKVSTTDVTEAQKLVDLSNQIISIQQKYASEHEISLQARKSAVNLVNSVSSSHPVRICMAVPMTSKFTVMKGITESPFWNNLFDSFMKSIDWKSNKYIYGFYLGFDKADNLYDTGDAWTELREEFKNRATYRMKEQFVNDSDIENILESQLTLKLMHFEHLEGAPTQVVSQLALTAYVDEYDYFYQVNDDTIIVTANWSPLLIEKLASNPFIPNFGVTGPRDSNNEKIFTHSFTHRTHIEVFGHLFPPSFKNWWSDDWITTVYGADHTFLAPDVEIKHNVGAQKEKSTTRYEVDQSAQLKLEEELINGYVQIDQWLKKKEYPRLALPNICGYVPLVRHLAQRLIKTDNNFHPETVILSNKNVELIDMA